MTIARHRAHSIASQLHRLELEQIPNARQMVTRLQQQLAILKAQGAPNHERETARRRLSDWVQDLRAFRKQAAAMRRLLQLCGPRY